MIMDNSEAQLSLDTQRAYTLQQVLVSEDWFRDVAIPILGNVSTDARRFGINLYQLDKYDDSSTGRRALIVLPK